jgi:glycosyltransferase involved in cell wall biosynthesis
MAAILKFIMHHRTQGKGVEAVHLLGIKEGLESLDHQVSIASPLGIEVSHTIQEAPSASSTRIMSTFSKYAPQVIFEFLEICNNFTAAKTLERLRNEHGCDILYERFALLNWIGAFKAKSWGAKFVVEVNYTTDSPLGIRHKTKLFAGLARRIERFTYERADLLLPVSSTLANELLAKGYPEEKILISPNAVHPEKFPLLVKDHKLSHKLGLRDGLTIGYVGGFAPWHGLEILIEAVAQIPKSRNTLNLLLIGDGPTMDIVRALAERFRDRFRILTPGRIEHFNLPSYLSIMDIMVMPNSNNYGSPMKIFEYMASGKPVVAPDYQPLRDVIKDETDGLLFRPNNPQPLARVLEKLIQNPELRQRLGNNARQRVLQEHNWKNRTIRIVDRLLTLTV